ncbi:MAG: PDZ domain-containing protein [Myxococcales bacterium FL481]|nr:MAG: PDZ domain-containing protein [Myxococcales bacterium FL481]
MASRTAELAASILRWKIARQLTLGGIMLAATVSTAAVSTLHLATAPAYTYSSRTIPVTRVETFSGIGIGFTQLGPHTVVTDVFPGTPADGNIFPGAILLSVNGERGSTLGEWNRLIRGQAGTDAKFELEYGDTGCRQTVTLTRAVISIEH